MNNLFEKILIVLPQIEEDKDYDLDGEPLQRGFELAEQFASNLHLLQTTNAQPILQGVLSAAPAFAALNEEYADREHARIARLVERARSKHPGITITADVTLSVPRSEAIIRCASQRGATMILKASREEKFLLGILSNTDWDLIREAPVPVWLAHGESDPRRGIVTALDLETNATGELETRSKHFRGRKCSQRATRCRTLYRACLRGTCAGSVCRLYAVVPRRPRSPDHGGAANHPGRAKTAHCANPRETAG